MENDNGGDEAKGKCTIETSQQQPRMRIDLFLSGYSV